VNLAFFLLLYRYSDIASFALAYGSCGWIRSLNYDLAESRVELALESGQRPAQHVSSRSLEFA
jgi:hypothetical protein